MLKRLIFFILIFSSHSNLILSQDLHWATSIGGTGLERETSLFVDSDGNVYVTGLFQDTVDFDQGPGVFSLIAVGPSDAFVTKLDKHGNHIWSIQFGGFNSFSTNCNSLSVDDSGNVIITGSFSYTIDFDPGPGVYNLSSSGGNHDAFICKLNSSGALVWAIDFGNNSGDSGFDITTDYLGYIYATGYFSGTVDFDPGPGMFTYSTITGASHTYILKLTSTGNFIWAKQFGAGWSSYAYTLKLDNLGNIYSAGIFAGICDFNPGNPTFYLTSCGINDGFIAKLDNNGEFLFAKQICGTADDRLSSMTMDQFCNIYLIGSFGLTADFDPGPGIANMNSYGSADIFIAKFDSSGNYLWAKQIGDTLNDEGSYISIDPSSNIYITGSFNGTVDFDTGPDSLYLISDSLDVFIAKMDSAANFIWAEKIGGPLIDFGGSILVDNLNSIYLTGGYQETVDFDLDSGSLNFISSGSFDMFIAKYRQCSNTNSTINVTACDNFESPSGNIVWVNSGIYNDTILNVAGCDSVIEINLTILTSPVVNISALGSTTFCRGDSVLLSATSLMNNYQWYRNNVAIAGATFMNYTVKHRGKYKCVAENVASCSDTSNIITVNIPCIPIDPAQDRSINITTDDIQEIQIFPNPGTGKFMLIAPLGWMQIFNSSGKYLYSLEIKEDETVLDISEFPDGIYLLKRISEKKNYLSKILLIR